eukprot:SAG31_NODE_1347_length_8693_cov_32.744938_1_plen_358_part_00
MSLEDIYGRWDRLVAEERRPVLEAIVKELHAKGVSSERELSAALNAARKLHHMTPRKSELLQVYLSLVARRELKGGRLRQALIKKHSKSESGVLVVTVLTAPHPAFTDPATGNFVTQSFSCEWNCYYCPNEPGQPRSYLHDEPSVLRANMNRFDPVLQFVDRCATLAQNGHPVDKVELLVLGGTWTSYPIAYQEEFVRDLFFAANTFLNRGQSTVDTSSELRPRLSLKEEQAINETASVKIIGLTLETRPDTILDAGGETLVQLRKYGCTRVQLGLQHTDDNILRKINRGCSTAQAIEAIGLLKDSGFKVDVHLMPNLPGATPKLDREMFDRLLFDPLLQADQWKIYPCEIVPWTGS